MRRYVNLQRIPVAPVPSTVAEPMARSTKDAMLPAKLQPGDRVRFVSPASPVSKDGLKHGAKVLEDLGLAVEYGKHVYDEHDTIDYLAGKDEDRLADINDALRDPGIKAIIATRGGKGAYRIADGLDLEAARKYPKLLVGFSEITILHMALFRHGILGGIHGAPWDAKGFGKETAASFVKAVTSTEPITIHATKSEHTHALTTHGQAEGVLIGGNQDSIATGAGWILPSFDRAILLIEAVNLRLGHIDRQLTMLIKSGIIKNVVAIAVGQYTDCGNATDPTGSSNCTEIDILRDRFGLLGVPILGGLSIGHGKNPIAVPIGTRAMLDANAQTLTISSGVQ
jgi:muramoyltetrapeptide carboxypeptidase